MAYKGTYKCENPSKYKGNSSKIIYRSLWELKLFRILDSHPNVLWWQSEELAIPYISPIDGRIHRYFPDVIYCKDVNGKMKTIMIEVKPLKQTKPPDIAKKNNTKSGRISRRYLNEVKTYGVNEAKWNAAKHYCDNMGWEFLIMTEKELGIK